MKPMRTRAALRKAVLQSLRNRKTATPAEVASGLHEGPQRVFTALKSLLKAGKIVERREPHRFEVVAK